MSYLSENNLYERIRNTVAEAQQKVYATVNFVMVETYWNVGKQPMNPTLWNSPMDSDQAEIVMML